VAEALSVPGAHSLDPSDIVIRVAELCGACSPGLSVTMAFLTPAFPMAACVWAPSPIFLQPLILLFGCLLLREVASRKELNLAGSLRTARSYSKPFSNRGDHFCLPRLLVGTIFRDDHTIDISRPINLLHDFADGLRWID